MSLGPWKERPYDREEVLGAFAKYIEEEDVPIVAEFCYQQKIPRSTFLTWPESAYLVEMSKMKKEAALEAGSLNGSMNTTMAIFSLKQLGWSDRHDLTHANPDGSPLSLVAQIMGQPIKPVDVTPDE